MGLLSFFSKKPEDMAKNGQELFEKKQYAQAVREYEKALDRHEKNPSFTSNFEKTISGQIQSAKKALAEQHVNTAKELVESKCFEDAKDLLNIALELTDNRIIRDTTDKLLENIHASEIDSMEESFGETDYDDGKEDLQGDSEEDFDDREYAIVIINSLPEDEQDAYLSYGQAFFRGFAALNQGDFERGADYLKMALKENKGLKTFIPLELGTCYLNTGELEKAKDLVSAFIHDFPLSLRGYQILCEILWGLKDYDSAIDLLQSCPKELSETALITLLFGQTHSEAGNLHEAIELYTTFLNQNAGDDLILRSLGNAYEKLGETKKAQNIYAELINACTSCGRQADLDLKKRFADTSFDTRHYTIAVLELYLELATSDPDHRGEYYKKVSEIYKIIGNETEAKRFKTFSKEIR